MKQRKYLGHFTHYDHFGDIVSNIAVLIIWPGQVQEAGEKERMEKMQIHKWFILDRCVLQVLEGKYRKNI